jgi:protein-disulfide isomerase
MPVLRQNNMAKLKPPVRREDHIQGNPQAAVVLTEYGDLECPHCGIAHTILKKLEAKYKDQLALVFRHFPLSEAHPHAVMAAIAAEAAARQGRFWEMHDMIFENQSKLSASYLLRMAESLQLDMAAFKKDQTDPKLAEKVDADFESGIMSGVNGTPSFYINGVKYNNSYDFESMSEAIDQTIANHPVAK